MNIDEFLEDLLKEMCTKDQINNIKQSVKENIDKDFSNIKVEAAVHHYITEDDVRDYDCTLDIKSESYNDGEIIFLDCIVSED